MKARFLILPVLAASLTLGGCGGATARYARSMERGQAYLASGDLDKAKVEFRNAMQISPKDAEAHYQAGLVAERRQDFREALLMYKGAIDLKPDYPEARARYARIFVFGGAPDRALEIVGEGLAKHPDDAEMLVVRGAAYMQTKKSVEARVDAEHAVKVAPDNENAVALLASIHRAADERDAAIELLDGTLKRVPRALDLRRILASLQIEAGNLPAAQQQLRAAVKLDPKQLPLRYELANFYLRTRDLDSAQQVFEEAVAAVPTSNEAKLVLANFLVTQRSRAAGEKMLRAHVAREPDNIELKLGLAALLEGAGAGADAVKVYQEIMAKDAGGPSGFTARNRVALYEAGQGHTATALGLLDGILKDNPRNADALVLRARLSTESGNPAAAVVDLRAALRDSPNSIDAHRMLARAHIANGEPALAEEALRKAVELAPTDAILRVQLAEFLTRTGRSAAAVAMLEDTVRRRPTDPTVREALVRAYVETGSIDEAIRGAEDLKVLLPHSPMGPFLRGQIAQLERQSAIAEKEYLLALEAAPRAMDVLAALSRVQLAAGRGAEAIARVEKSAAAEENAAVRNLQGELLLGTGQPARAAEPLERATALAPRWWLPYRNLAIAHYQLKDAAGAIAVYQRGRKQAPHEAALAVDLAALFELQNRVDDAIRVYEDFRKENPRNDLATNNLAKLLLAHRQDPASLARVTELTLPFANSHDPALLDTFGWVLFRKGEYTAAQTTLERAFAAAPDSGSVRYHLALVQVQNGQVAKAIDNLELAVAAPHPFTGLAEARNLLKDLKARAG